MASVRLGSLGSLRTASSRRRAFSLLELMVAMVLMLVALAITAQLVLDAQVSIDHSGRRHLDMSADQAFDQLRYDARSSSDFIRPPDFGSGFWVSTEALRFSGHISGDTIVYALEDNEWRRLVFRSGYTDPVASRLMLDRVSRFRYRTVEGTPRPSLEVELTYVETPPLTARTAAGQAAASTGAVRVVGLVLTPRLVGESSPSSWW